MSDGEWYAPVGGEPVTALVRRGDDLAAAAPRIALFLFGCPDSAAAPRILERIHPEVRARLEEIEVM